MKIQLVTKLELKYLDLEHYGLSRFMARFFSILFSIFWKRTIIIVPINFSQNRIGKKDTY
jgi:hypothetical protein